MTLNHLSPKLQATYSLYLFVITNKKLKKSNAEENFFKIKMKISLFSLLTEWTLTIYEQICFIPKRLILNTFLELVKGLLSSSQLQFPIASKAVASGPEVWWSRMWFAILRQGNHIYLGVHCLINYKKRTEFVKEICTLISIKIYCSAFGLEPTTSRT